MLSLIKSPYIRIFVTVFSQMTMRLAAVTFHQDVFFRFTLIFCLLFFRVFLDLAAHRKFAFLATTPPKRFSIRVLVRSAAPVKIFTRIVLF
jgi:hypothetical protein